MRLCLTVMVLLSGCLGSGPGAGADMTQGDHPGDLAGVDLVGADLTGAPGSDAQQPGDMATTQPGDLAGTPGDMASGTVMCADGTFKLPLGAACSSNPSCCNGLCGSANNQPPYQCCLATATNCMADSDCCSGHCTGAGKTCQ